MKAVGSAFGAELLGTGLLVTTVVGSGIMAERLSGGNIGIALLANSIATGAMLVALITTFGYLSGAHFNPVVTLVEAAMGRLRLKVVVHHLIAQFSGAIAGTMTAHWMFAMPAITLSTHIRTGPSQWFSEGVATFGLMTVILHVARTRPASIPVAVAGYITAAYWFTASTSFANPAVTIARCLTDSFSGVRPIDVPGFILSQIIGAFSALGAYRLIRPASGPDRAAE